MENIEILQKILGNLPNTIILLIIAFFLYLYFRKNSLSNLEKYLDIYEQIGKNNEKLIKDLTLKINELEKEVAGYKKVLAEIKQCAHLQSSPVLKCSDKKSSKKK